MQFLVKKAIVVSGLARATAIKNLYGNDNLESQYKRYKSIIDAADLAGKLHNIGELVPDVDTVIDGAILYNHEASSAIFDMVYDSLPAKYKSSDFKRLVEYALYNQVPARNYSKDLEDLTSFDAVKIPTTEHANISSFMKMVGIKNSIGKFSKITSGAEFPKYLDDNGTTERLFTLLCLTSAIRIIDGWSEADIDLLIEKGNYEDYLVEESKPCKYTIPESFDAVRLKQQIKIARESLKYLTVQVNAPTAYGKTVVMFIRMLLSGRRTYLVCPRNDIADNIYHEIVELIKLFNVKIDIELYYASKRVASNSDNICDEFTSQIVITNIDNYAASFSKSKYSSREYNIFTSDLIMDEFHELITDSPLFGVFVEIVRMRAQLSNNSTTLLVSATPSIISEIISEDITYLPEKGKHYPSVNKMPCHIMSGEAPPEEIKGGDVTILNAISNVQKYHEENKLNAIIHSKYMPYDRRANIAKFLANFGKNSTTVSKYRTVASPLVQASLNVSWIRMFESVCSIETTFQRLGRVNRFGEYPISEFTSFKSSDRAEISARNAVYSVELGNLWHEEYSKLAENRPTITYDEMYEEYHKFNEKYRTKILKYLTELYSHAITEYNKYNLRPKRMSERAKVEVIGSFAKRGLRDPLGGIFYVPTKSLQKYHTVSEERPACDMVLSMRFVDFIDRFNAVSVNDKINKFKKLVGTGVEDKTFVIEVQKLIDAGYIAWQSILDDYRAKSARKNHKAPYFNLKRLVSIGSWDQTPIPGLNFSYDDERGVIDNFKIV